MNLYLITLYDPYDRELARIEQHASSMALALLVSEARLRGLQGAVSAQVDLVVDEPGFRCLVDESAGQSEAFAAGLEGPAARTAPVADPGGRELHSVRAELHDRPAVWHVDPKEVA